VTGPLELARTGFSAAEVNGGPLATPYGDADPEPVRMTDPYSHSDDTLVYSPGRALDPAAFPSAGAGMVGTAPEMLTFLPSPMTAPEPTNRPAPMTPPIATIVRWRCQ
jgi:CubicO group peptidase (beta-lactamase class C family)